MAAAATLAVGDDFAAIKLRITTSAQLPDLTNSEVDVAVAYGLEDHYRSPVVEVERLLDDDIVPVRSSGYRRAQGGLRTEGELLSGVLLHDDQALAEQGADWDTWLSTAGIGSSSLAENIRFNTCASAIDAAAAGQGWRWGGSVSLPTTSPPAA